MNRNQTQSILIVVGLFPCISEQFIVNQLVGLLEAGADVQICSAKTGDRSQVSREFDEYKLVERWIPVGVPQSVAKRLFGWLWRFLCLLFVEPSVAFRALNVWKYRIAAMNGKTVFFAFDFVKNKRFFDVIHAHFGPNGLLASFLSECGFCSHTVCTFHGADINTYPRKHGITVYKHLYYHVDAITTNTKFTAGRVIANGCDPAKITIMPVTLFVDRFPLRTYVPDYSRFTLLTVGRLVEKKGHEFSLRAVARLTSSIPNLNYRIVGDGPLRESLTQLTARLGIENNVSFIGFKTGEELREEFERADVFTLPSITAANGDMEGQGLVLQEAQAIGVPVVTTRHNGIPDGVLNGETGILVNERDVDGLARAILFFAHDRQKIDQFGRNGARFVREHYDVSVSTQRLLALYDGIRDENDAGQ